MLTQTKTLLAVVLMLGLAACHGSSPPSASAPAAPPKTVADHFDIGVGGHIVHMQLAVLEPEMERGLMERRNLEPDEGMIFVYNAPQQLNFWMRNTPTPLDIGYFTSQGLLAEVYPLLPYDERTVASHGTNLQFALEMNEGWYAGHDVHPGAQLDMKALGAALTARGFDPRKFIP